MNVNKLHFNLHFEPQFFVLYEENNGKYYRRKWEEVSQYKNIKRIHYNSENWKNYLIIDIDNDEIYKYKDAGLPNPNFILKNKDKPGAHLFYVLDKGIYFKNTYYLNKWQILQKEFTRLAGGDALNKGYVGKFINSKHFEYIELEIYSYNIDYLASKINFTSFNNQAYLPLKTQQDKVISISKKSENSPNVNIIGVGERNNAIFNKTRKYAYIQVLKYSEKLFANLVQEYAYKINNDLFIPLQDAEVKATVKSIVKYCQKHKEKIATYSKENHKQRGIMKLSKEQTLKEKQKLAAKYTHKQKKEKTLLKLQLCILSMKEKELKINISTLEKYSKITRKTIREHRENLAF